MGRTVVKRKNPTTSRETFKGTKRVLRRVGEMTMDRVELFIALRKTGLTEKEALAEARRAVDPAMPI